MFRTHLRRRIATIAFRAASFVALVSFMASVIGMPLPVVAPGKETSRQAAGTRRGCCCQIENKGTRQCCGHCGCSKSKPATAGAEEALQIEFVLSILARKCQGQAEIWLALGAVSPPPEPLQLTRELDFCALFVNADITLDSLTLDPATPPPRA